MLIYCHAGAEREKPRAAILTVQSKAIADAGAGYHIPRLVWKETITKEDPDEHLTGASDVRY
jgi:hypothetical protein